MSQQLDRESLARILEAKDIGRLPFSTLLRLFRDEITDFLPDGVCQVDHQRWETRSLFTSPGPRAPAPRQPAGTVERAANRTAMHHLPGQHHRCRRRRRSERGLYFHQQEPATRFCTRSRPAVQTIRGFRANPLTAFTLSNGRRRCTIKTGTICPPQIAPSSCSDWRPWRKSCSQAPGLSFR